MKELVIVVDNEYLSGLEKYKNYQVQHYVRHEMERFNKRQSFLLHIYISQLQYKHNLVI